ncbi:hypothetical protein [Micrococcus sp. HOU01]|uniref:hypothetical protein n=1 Tax=Micrococcus sp. HOU01 TaxID=3101753 RepID=UPI002D778347|nr:hypothetical protein [Micrococcus sp. HOU1]WRQ42645.1 hypothetical protein SOY78_06285 [Micrococcus sp. HOU1]
MDTVMIEFVVEDEDLAELDRLSQLCGDGYRSRFLHEAIAYMSSRDAAEHEHHPGHESAG